MGESDRASKGQPISARTWNRLVAAADWVDSMRGSLKGTSAKFVRDGALVARVKNTSGSTIPLFGVVGITDSLFTVAANAAEFKFRPALKGTTPAVASHLGKFAIALEPIPASQIRLCLIAGLAVMQIDVVDEADQFADVKDADNAKLRSSHWRGRGRILAKETGTGTKWAYVQLGTFVANKVIAKVTTQIGARAGTTLGSGVAEIYRRATNTITATGDSETIKNMSSAVVVVDSFIQAAWDGQGLLVDTQDCAI